MKLMRSLIIFILLFHLIYFKLNAQTSFQMDLYVLSTYKDTVICNQQKVKWVIKQDTLGFIFNNKELIFKETPSRYTKTTNIRSKYEKFSTYKDVKYEEKYSIYILINKDKYPGIIICISNYQYRDIFFTLSNNNICF